VDRLLTSVGSRKGSVDYRVKRPSTHNREQGSELGLRASAEAIGSSRYLGPGDCQGDDACDDREYQNGDTKLNNSESA
jgi:hypothetical protein